MHIDFIFSPISKILNDSVAASAGIGSGIETFPLCDYIMQSVFIKMTGFQEQKIKCICWDVASVDYEYRYEFTKKPLGECSSYYDKNTVYKELLSLIRKKHSNSKWISPRKEAIVSSVKQEVIKIFDGTNLSIWSESAFLDFKKILILTKSSHIASDVDIFSDSGLKSWYTEGLYKHRNRIAHNTSSYQQNLPTLKTLIHDRYRYENYFLYFFILMLIDEIFLELYSEFLCLVNNNAD